MISQVELSEMAVDRRERSGSANSDASMSPEESEPLNYSSLMTLEALKRAAGNLDISAFDRTRLFHPRKHRSCHKRAEPVSEELRKLESSKNSREYTKRNRDEISQCRVLFNKIHALHCRYCEVVNGLRSENVQRNVFAAVADFERIICNYLNFGTDMRQKLNIPTAEVFLVDYRKKAEEVVLFEHRPNTPNQHKEKLVELKEQYAKLTSDKDSLNSSKDKTNYASSKSRLNQRIMREKLKSDCWDCWKDINTMMVQGDKLQELCIQLKDDIWTNILGIYFNLLELSKQRPAGSDKQQIERIIEYFAPFSRKKSEMLIKLVPPEVEIIEDEAPPCLVPETKPDRASPVPRPQSMDMSQALRPDHLAKLMIHDRLITDNQTVSPALSSPVFTLALPTRPAGKNETVGKKETNGQMNPEATFFQLLNAPTGKNPTKKVKFNEDSDREDEEPEPQVQHKQNPLSNNQLTMPTMPAVAPAELNTMLPLPYLNPLQPAPQFQASPAFLQAMEQQRIMAAFLNYAFRQK
ncbi:hypothetical protein B9Z55_022751 [Caenorhabditis nigoni]|uniref:Uncharacterized protein n=1 Tax=Caenorhabditis nigoni TaxID=1611254 RepID=A0A2G5SLT0_9PELO|nr:hypothetical protein B9Z55_022751 [Caenorhabditis nigoni]